MSGEAPSKYHTSFSFFALTHTLRQIYSFQDSPQLTIWSSDPRWKPVQYAYVGGVCGVGGDEARNGGRPYQDGSILWQERVAADEHWSLQAQVWGVRPSEVVVMSSGGSRERLHLEFCVLVEQGAQLQVHMMLQNHTLTVCPSFLSGLKKPPPWTRLTCLTSFVQPSLMNTPGRSSVSTSQTGLSLVLRLFNSFGMSLIIQPH